MANASVGLKTNGEIEGMTRAETGIIWNTSPAPDRPKSQYRQSPEPEGPVSKTTGLRAKPNRVMSMDDEKSSVLMVVADLEKQLDMAFSIKDAQEEELASLKQELKNTQLRATELEGKVEALETELTSQEELETQLEFFENSRIETAEKINALEEDIKRKSASLEKFRQAARLHVAEIKSKDSSMEQLEVEFNKSIATNQNLQDQIALLEQKRDELADKLTSAEIELRKTIAEWEATKRSHEQANADLGEIRKLLTDTRDKARKNYYKKLQKTGEA